MDVSLHVPPAHPIKKNTWTALTTWLSSDGSLWHNEMRANVLRVWSTDEQRDEPGATRQPVRPHSPVSTLERGGGTEPSWFLPVALASTMATIENQAPTMAGPGKGSVLSLPRTAGQAIGEKAQFIIQNHTLVRQWKPFLSRGEDTEQQMWKNGVLLRQTHRWQPTAQKRVRRQLRAPSLMCTLKRFNLPFLLDLRCWKQAFYTRRPQRAHYWKG